MMTKKIKITKYYRASPTKYTPNKTAYFSIEYVITEIEQTEYGSLEVLATIRYGTVLEEEEMGYKKQADFTSVGHEWKLTANKDSCSLNKSLMVQSDYGSFKIGTFLLNEIMKMAIQKFPMAAMQVMLSTVDEYEENGVRRNSLYEKIGLKKTADNWHYAIDRIEELSIVDHIEGVEEISFARALDDMAEKIDELSFELRMKTDTIKINFQTVSDAYDRCREIKKYKYWFIAACLLAVVLIFR